MNDYAFMSFYSNEDSQHVKLAIPTSDHGLVGLKTRCRRDLSKTKRRFCSHSLSKPFSHRLGMTKILLKRI